MATPRDARLAWLVAPALVLLVVDLIASAVYAGVHHLGAKPVADLTGDALLAASFGLMGALLAVRRPRLPIGWLFLLAGIVWSTGCLTVWPHHLVNAGAHVPALAGVIASADALWAWPLAVAPGIQLPLILLPDGRLPSRRWRPVAVLALAMMVLTAASIAVVPAGLPGYGDLYNSGVPSLKTVADPASAVGSIVLLGIALIGLVRLVRLYRRSSGVARQQLRWVALGALCAVIGIVASAGTGSSTLPGIVTILGLCMVPLTMGVAVLRYRLYDLGRLVSRTVGYVLVTAVLVGVYAAIATLTGLVAAGRPIGVAAGTLAAAALFRPVRRRLQAAVDRRFDRTRYDRVATVEAFSNRLRAGIDLGVVRDDLVDVVERTLAPSSVSLWTPPAAPVVNVPAGG